MSGSYRRHERVAGQLRRELARLIWAELEDPRLGSVTVTDVEVSSDLAHARVYVESADPTTVRDSLEALHSAAGFLRRRLGRELRMRVMPELHFRYDDSAERGNRIEALLAEVRRPDAPRDAADDLHAVGPSDDDAEPAADQPRPTGDGR